MAISKGMTVEFTIKGETKLGTVARGGAKPTVRYLKDGQCYECKGSAKFFIPTTKKIELDSSKAMDAFEITGLREFKTWADHVGMECKIRKNGKIIGSVNDDGCGASYNYDFKSADDRKVFETAVAQWLKDHNSEKEYADVDTYVYWATIEKQLLVPAADYMSREY